jgi:hypothetical protein
MVNPTNIGVEAIERAVRRSSETSQLSAARCDREKQHS